MKVATLCYVQRDGKTLMMHRGKKRDDIHAGKWNGLGGKLEVGEDPHSCVIREVEEESGLKIDRPRLSGVLSFPFFKDNEDWHVFVFVANRYSGTIRECAEGELQWIDNAVLLDLPLWAGDQVFLPALLEGDFFTGSFRYKDKVLVEYSFQRYERSPGEIATCALG